MAKKKNLTTQDVELQEEVVVAEVPEEVFTEEDFTEEENQEVEERELTDEEKKQILIEQLKYARKTFRPIKHIGKTTINPYGAAFKENRRRKNQAQRKSRKLNRKK
jgi:hypothetical protein